MAGLAPLARLQAFNSSGVPLAGAKLYTYAAGTSTALATYTTSALSVENANPQIADAGGLFGATYLAASAYKFVLKTSADVEVWTQDNIENATATNIVNADISASAAIAWSKISKVGSSLSDLTTRSAAALSSGSIPDGRVPSSAVTQHQTALSIAGSQLTGTIASAVQDNITRLGTIASGTVPWANVSKTGSSLADLTTKSASELSSGTLPDARFPATLPAASGVNLTALNASAVASGTLAQARLGTVLGAWSGALTVDTVIQAATDLLVVVVPDGSTTISFVTDSSNPPTVQRGYANGSNGTSICCPVKKSDYFKAALAGGSTAVIYSIPLGTSS